MENEQKTKEIEWFRDLADLLADDVEAKTQEPPRYPDLDAIRWMALGMAVADKRFRDKLFNDVGCRAFGDREDAAELVKSMDDKGTKRQFALLIEYAGFQARDGEFLSEAILRILCKEDKAAWLARDDRLEQLMRQVTEDMAKLRTIIRVRPGLKPQPIPPEMEE